MDGSPDAMGMNVGFRPVSKGILAFTQRGARAVRRSELSATPAQVGTLQKRFHGIDFVHHRAADRLRCERRPHGVRLRLRHDEQQNAAVNGVRDAANAPVRIVVNDERCVDASDDSALRIDHAAGAVDVSKERGAVEIAENLAVAHACDRLAGRLSERYHAARVDDRDDRVRRPIHRSHNPTRASRTAVACASSTALTSLSARLFSSRGICRTRDEANFRKSEVALACSGRIFASLTRYSPLSWRTTSSESRQTSTSVQPASSARCNVAMRAWYSATLFVATPRNSDTSAITVPSDATITPPPAAGPGLPRAPPSV